MKILIAGGSGFIGKNFLLKTPRHWECFATYNSCQSFPDFLKIKKLNHVRSVEIDMSDPRCVKSRFAKVGNEFDICLYIMGNSDIELSRQEPLMDVRANIHAVINLLQNINVKKFIFMSSGAVYEGHHGLVHPGKPLSPTMPYAINKLSSELLIRFYQKNTNHIEDYINIRFFGAYGPMEPERKIYTNLIKTFLLENKNTFRIRGNGKNLIDAMYIDDTVDALLRIAMSDKRNLTIDLCYGNPRTINELVLEVGRIFGRDVELLHEGSVAEYTTFYASPEAMKALYNFRPKILLEQGIKEFSKYLCS